MRARTPHHRAYWPQEVQVFWPLITNSSSVATAPVRSDPEVGSGIRLRETLAPDLLRGEDRWDVARALGIVAERQQRGTDHVQTDDVGELGRAGGRQFLVDDDLLHGRAAATSELRRPCPADVAGLIAQALPLAQETHPVIEPVGHVLWGRTVLAQELPDLVPEPSLLGGLTEIHELKSYQIWAVAVLRPGADVPALTRWS